MSNRSRKPDTRTAMRQLIAQVREAIPFSLSDQQICGDSCEGCSSKLLIYLETELDAWESRLADGVVPSFGDLERLAKQGRKIHRVLQRNGVLEAQSQR
ncbi:MAG: hypothetical protein PVF13_00095 [Chromatiales bacterium]